MVNPNHTFKQLYATYVLIWSAITSRYSFGKNVYEDDWDVLVLLDACRTDALQEVSSEYDFLNDIGEIHSVGSTSKEWIERTFRQKYSSEINNTAYITANPFSDTLMGKRDPLEYIATHDTWINSHRISRLSVDNNVVDMSEFGHVEALWGSTDNNGFYDCQKPDSVTKYVIKASRSNKYDRVLAHYMQPHHPFFSSSEEIDNLSEMERHPFNALKNGKNDEVWDAYLDNLRYGLDWVEKLINNVDGKVVITSDHGELMGELGMYFHMVGNIHPKLKKVPWVEINATDNKTIEPNISFSGTRDSKVSKDQLEALGYI